MKNTAKIDTKLESMVNFISEDEARDIFGLALASTLINPSVVWAKFTLTDDQVNGNGQRIPDNEFANLISTGINMPIKMAQGEINPGHEDSKPLGVITHLKEIVTEAGTKAIIALAALWGDERPADVQYLKQRYSEKLPIDVSWEIFYQDAQFNPELNSMDLMYTILRAATIVGNPAYQGRTKFLSVAAKKWSKAYTDQLPNENFLYVDDKGGKHLPIMDADGLLDRAKLQEALNGLGELDLPTPLLKQKKAMVNSMLERFNAGASLDEVSRQFYPGSARLEEPKLNELEELKAKLADATKALEEKEVALAEKLTAVSELQAQVTKLGEELKAKDEEIKPLREFKDGKDAETARAESLASVKTKFTEAGVEKSDEFFAENADTLLKLDEASLNLMISEAKKPEGDGKTASASSKKNIEIPALQEEGTEDLSDPKVLAAALKKSNAKKQ